MALVRTCVTADALLGRCVRTQRSTRRGSATIAAARTSIRRAPAARKARAQAETVAPVVITSSTSTMARSATRGRAAVGDGEGASDVLRALAGAGPDLRRRRARLAQHEGVECDAARRGDLPCQQCRLVELPPDQPPARHRHRHDQVGIGEQLGTGPCHPARQQAARLVAIGVLEAMDQFAHDMVEHGRGAGPVVGRGIGGRRGRNQRPVTAAERQRQAEPVAQRRRDERDLLPTRSAKRVVGRNARMAAEADGGRNDIAGTAEDAAERPPKSLLDAVLRRSSRALRSIPVRCRRFRSWPPRHRLRSADMIAAASEKSCN